MGIGTRSDEHELSRDKRELFTAIALIGGLIGTGLSVGSIVLSEAGDSELGKEIDELKQRYRLDQSRVSNTIHHIYRRIATLEEQGNKNADAFDLVSKSIVKLERRSNKIERKVDINSAVTSSENVAQICHDTMSDMADIIMDAMSGRLNVKAAPPRWLRSTYHAFQNRAKAEGMRTLLNSPHDILKGKVAFMMQNGTVDLVVSIPVFNPRSTFRLFKYVPFPFATDSGQFAYIHPVREYLAVTDEHAYFKAFSFSELYTTCRKQENVYFCSDNVPHVPRAGLQKADPATRCLGTMFLNDAAKVMTACDLSSVNPFHSVVQLDNATFFIASPHSQTLSVSCSKGETFSRKIDQIAMVKINRRDCRLTTDVYVTQITPNASVGILPRSRAFIERSLESSVNAFLKEGLKLAKRENGESDAIEDLAEQISILTRPPTPSGGNGGDDDDLPVFTWLSGTQELFGSPHRIVRDTLYNVFGLGLSPFKMGIFVAVVCIGAIVILIMCCGCGKCFWKRYRRRLGPSNDIEMF